MLKTYFFISFSHISPIPLLGDPPVVLSRSEGFPLAGLFHPWAQWDLGLDTLENSSRRVVVVAPRGMFSPQKAISGDGFSASTYRLAKKVFFW